MSTQSRDALIAVIGHFQAKRDEAEERGMRNARLGDVAGAFRWQTAMEKYEDVANALRHVPYSVIDEAWENNAKKEGAA